jgi:hypothetical protein
VRHDSLIHTRGKPPMCPDQRRVTSTIESDLGKISCLRADNGSIQLQIPVRNIGPGPAFLKYPFISTGTGESDYIVLHSDYQVIPGGELAVLSLTLSSSDAMHSQLVAALELGSSVLRSSTWTSAERNEL